MRDDINGKEVLKKYADSDGFISKNIPEILEEMDLEYGYEERLEMEKALNEAMNFHDIEFENEKQKRWKFKE